MPPPAELTDADALRILSDQLEEHGLDAGAALLRDVAGRLERCVRLVGPVVARFSGELLVRSIRWNRGDLQHVRFCEHAVAGLTHYTASIEAEPVGTWIQHEVKP